MILCRALSYEENTLDKSLLNIVSVWIVVGVTAVLLVINSWFIKGKANPIIRNMTTPVLCYAFFAVAQIVEVSVNA